jgi:hypothetical protein
MAEARPVLPVPVSPMKTMFSAASTKCSSASCSMTRRSTVGCFFQG